MTNGANIRVLLAGGGSGGHVFPALAVGEELSARGCGVSFAGAAGGMEARLVPERGLEFHALRARPLVGRGALGKVMALATLALSSLSGARLVRRLGAAAVLGTGGYASAPAVLGARLARRPALLLEPNARPGFANRRLARFVSGAAVAFPEAAGDLSCATRETGVPVRRVFFEQRRALPSGGPRLLILGGSQGARSLNSGVPAAMAGTDGLLARLPDLSVIHQTGAGGLESTRAAYRDAGLDPDEPCVDPEGRQTPRVKLVPFIDDVAGQMASSHLVVSRAGAVTVAEIAAVARPSVLVPLALAEGHQESNARALERAGAARTVVQEDTGEEATPFPERLGAVLGELLGDRERLEEMASAAASLARPNAAAAIADWLLELAPPVRAAAHPGGAA